MLDEKLLRRDLDYVVTQMARRKVNFNAAEFAALEARRKQADVQLQDLQAERNSASKRIGQLIQDGMDVQSAKQQQAEALQHIDRQMETVKHEQNDVRAQIDQLLLGLPNIPDPEVPDGDDEASNVELARWGEPRRFEFEIKDHVDLGLRGGLLDFETGAKLTGSRFVVMRQELALLHRALIQLMLNTHTQQHGYQEVYVPYLVNSASMLGTGQLPKFAHDSFVIDSGDHEAYYLIPTAEVPVTNLVRGSIVSAQDTPNLGDLPLRFVCHSPCFRSEAGSYGRDTRGMIRQHQFEKVELVQLIDPMHSDEALEQLTYHAEAILKVLELPYRKVILCTGDLGAGAARTYDLEVWLPGQNAYREISSCSNFRDFQARRMAARWRNPATSKPELMHTVNGSALAVGRTMVAVLENYQNADGSVTVPEALRAYMGDKDRLLIP